MSERNRRKNALLSQPSIIAGTDHRLPEQDRKPFVRIGAAKALAQFGGVTPAVGKTPRQTAPSRQRSSVVGHFSDTRAMLPLASRALPTARPVRATYRFAEDQTLLSGDTCVASCGNFPNHHSSHATPHFSRGRIVPPNGGMKRTAILSVRALVKLPALGKKSGFRRLSQFPVEPH
jgi:hypothetical protein